jgi:hypothetical protein
VDADYAPNRLEVSVPRTHSELDSSSENPFTPRKLGSPRHNRVYHRGRKAANPGAANHITTPTAAKRLNTPDDVTQALATLLGAKPEPRSGNGELVKQAAEVGISAEQLGALCVMLGAGNAGANADPHMPPQAGVSSAAPRNRGRRLVSPPRSPRQQATPGSQMPTTTRSLTNVYTPKLQEQAGFAWRQPDVPSRLAAGLSAPLAIDLTQLASARRKVAQDLRKLKEEGDESNRDLRIQLRRQLQQYRRHQKSTSKRLAVPNVKVVLSRSWKVSSKAATSYLHRGVTPHLDSKVTAK